MRRLATVVTTLVLSVSGLVFSPAQANVPADGLYVCTTGQPRVDPDTSPAYTITNGSVFKDLNTSSGAACIGAVVIPDGVTSIGIRAFRTASSVTSVSIPASVTSIGENAFRNMAALTSITIPAAVTTIGPNAFQDSTALTTVTFASGSQLTSIPNFAFLSASQLSSINIPASVTSIGTGAFQHGRALTDITIKANVTSIGNAAFFDSQGLATVTFESGSNLASIGAQAFMQATALTSITVPASVTTIGAGAFSNSTFFSLPGVLSLTTIAVDPANPNYSSIDGVLFNKNATTLIQYPSKKSGTSYSIPAGVTSIGNSAFARATNLTSVAIPTSVTTIGDQAFRQTTALSSVTIPSGVTSIGSDAFGGASALADVTFSGNSAPTIGSNAFTGVASSAKACVKSGATGFTTSGSPARWNGIGVNDGAYMASFNANGGSAVAGVSFLANGQISSAPAEPTRTGYTFAGWTATDGGSMIVTFPNTPSATCGTTLHAKWDLIPVVNEPAPAVSNPAPAVSNPAPAVSNPAPAVSNPAPAVSNPAPAPAQAQAPAPAQAATTNVVSAKSNYSAKSLATQVGVTTVSPKATVTISVAKSSKKFCTKSGSKLKTLKAGSCVVTITVQEPKPKGGKKPKATKTIKTLVVS